MRAFVPTLIFSCACAVAQTVIPTEFPPDASEATADELRQGFSGKVFKATAADGKSWRIQTNDNGFVFVNVGGTYSDNGTWHVQDNKWCADMRKTGQGCNEVRRNGQVIYLKRSRTGEVLRLMPG